MTKDEVVEWHLRLNGHEFEQTPGDGDTILPSHLLLSPSAPAFNLSQHQDLFQ